MLRRGTTIAAISTPWGEGGIGVVRISGPAALDVAERVLRLGGGKSLVEIPPRTVKYGRVVTADGAPIDEALVFYFRAPRSYTGEDLVEIQAHGSPVLLRRILAATLAAGAIMAEPGEFTARAVWNGRINLLQAEAVLDLIRAKTASAASAALKRLAGEDGGELLRIERSILELLAEVEAGLDFPEDIPAPGAADLSARAAEALGRLDAVLSGAERGRLLFEGADVVLAGRPNVGKSSLLNALLGEDRAIVTDIPGTTRDTVSEEIDLGGIPVRLVDTAGLGRAANELEALGMERSRQEITRADLTLLVLDGSQPLTALDEDLARDLAGQRPGLAVVNKADLPRRLEGLPAPIADWPVRTVSALTRDGLDGLREGILAALSGMQIEGTPVLGHLRQIEAAREARASLAAFLDGLRSGLTLDFLAEDLRGSLRALGRLTGREAGPEVIREIFSRFCLGK